MVYAVFPSVSNRSGSKRFHYVLSLSCRFSRINDILTQTSIINTLAIGVYFSVVTSLDTGYWDNLLNVMNENGCGDDFYLFYCRIRNIIIAGITTGCIAVIITFLYYFKPPQSAEDCIVIKVNDFPVSDLQGKPLEPQDIASHPEVSPPLHSRTTSAAADVEMKTTSSGASSVDGMESMVHRDSNLLLPNARKEFEAAWNEFTLDYIEYLELMGYIAVFCTYVSIICFLFLLMSLYDKFSVPTKYICSGTNIQSTTAAGIVFGSFGCFALCAMKIGYGTELFPRFAARIGLKASPHLYRLVNFAAYVLLHFAALFTPLFVAVYLTV